MPPESVSGLESASFKVTVIVDVAVPSARILVGEAVIVDVMSEGSPGTTAKESDSPDLPLTSDDAPVPVAATTTPDSALEYVTPVIVTADAPTAIVPEVVPPNVPEPVERVRVTVPSAPVLFTALP